MTKLIITLAALLAIPAFAAEPVSQDGPVVAFGLLGGQGHTNTLTRKVWGGHTAEFGFQVTPEGYGVSFMPYMGWGRLPGRRDIPDRAVDTLWGPNSYDLFHWRGGVDIRFRPVDRWPLTVTFGPSLHQWQIQRVGVTEKLQGDTRDIKLGFRLGAEYQVTPEWSAAITFTQTEWRNQRDVSTWKGYKSDALTPSFIEGLNPCRPAYISLMARYRF